MSSGADALHLASLRTGALLIAAEAWGLGLNRHSAAESSAPQLLLRVLSLVRSSHGFVM